MTRILESHARGFLENLRRQPELLEKFGVNDDNVRSTASALAQDFRFPEGTYGRKEPESNLLEALDLLDTLGTFVLRFLPMSSNTSNLLEALDLPESS